MKNDNRIDIDENRLDSEWIEHPGKVRRCGRKLADARLDRDEAKADLDLAKEELDHAFAKMDQRIRADPEAYGLKPKPVEASIKNAIYRSKLYRKEVLDVDAARRKLNQAQHLVGILEVDWEALAQQRRRALENAVHLWSLDYGNTELRQPRNRRAQEKIRQAQDKVSSGAGRRQKRGRGGDSDNGND